MKEIEQDFSLGLIEWIGNNMTSKFMVNKALTKTMIMWAKNSDAESMWDGIDDDRLQFYTHEQVKDMYMEYLKNKSKI